MKVNSYTIFGENRDLWAHNVATNLRQHVTMYPGWGFWLYIDEPFSDNGYGAVVNKLAKEGFLKLKVVQYNGQQYTERWKTMMMLWRLLPIWEGVEYVFCRDMDSILTPRQLQCVLEFINSGKVAHGIQDNDGHDIPLMGGMCGFKSNKFIDRTQSKSLSDLIQNTYSADAWRSHGNDQTFLTNHIWSKLKSDSLIHKLYGPNRRSHMKHVFDVNVSFVPKTIRDQGDDYTNYIGAAGTIPYSSRTITDFYDEHGNRTCKDIAKIEKELGFNI